MLVAAVILFTATFRITDYLSRLRNPEQAKISGEKLARLTNKTVIAVVAHPDDAEWYTGGTLSLLAKNNKVIVVVGTSGEKGGPPAGNAVRAGNNIPALGKVREKEQRNAGKILGYDQIIFLRIPDRDLKSNGEFKNQIEEVFNKYKPEVLFTFDSIKQGYIYRHSDHLAAGQVSYEIAKNTKFVEKAYLFHSSKPDVVVDVKDVTDEKVKALEAHSSQRDLRSRRPALRTFMRIMSFLPFRARRMSFGSNKSFSNIGIQQGELFREVIINK